VGVLILLIGVYFYELQLIRSQTEAAFQYRTELVKNYVNAMRQNVDALARTYVQSYAAVPADKSAHLRWHDEFQSWTLSGFTSDETATTLAGSATGPEHLPRPPSVLRELAAAVSLDPQIQSILDFDDEVSWVYYTSVQHFMYIAPKVPVADFRFTDSLYDKPFWWPAIPEHNPEQKQIISDLYEDGAGKGLMISISSPVSIEHKFIGVVSLDLGIQMLQRRLEAGDAPGETLLVGKSGKIVARKAKFSPQEHYEQPPKAANWWADSQGSQWLSSDIAQGQLTILHRIRGGELYTEAMLRSLPIWILSLLLFVLLLLLLRLSSALNMVSRLSHRDQLTDALNRHGLLDRADLLHALARRRGNTVAAAIFDLDFFKKINDQHGHEIGDDILRVVSWAMKEQLREYDLLCRWGGEEFVALFLVDTFAAVPIVAERLRSAHSDSAMGVTLSGGVVIWRDDETLHEAVRRADRLLYEAKADGRNCLKSDCVPVSAT